jgi:iron complex transport system permease protein
MTTSTFAFSGFSAFLRAQRASGHGMTLLLALALIAALIGSLCIGHYPLSFWQAGKILLHLAFPFSQPDVTTWEAREQVVVQVIRLPRVLLATFVGIALGISGATLQGMMRNPLVGPDLVGVSAGAAMGGVLAIMLDLPPAAFVLLAFLGGMFALGCAFGLVKLARAGTDGVPLVLAGIFVSAFCMAGVGLGQFLANDGQLAEITYWMLGSLTRANPARVAMIAIPVLVCASFLMLLRWRLNLLSLGDLDAAALGVNAPRLRWLVIAAVSWIVAAQVSVSGVIGWVGLVIPHCARMLVGPDHRRLLPASAMLGGLFVLGIDAVTRTLIQSEVAIGILTTLIGTPFIALLFWKKQTRGWNES